MTHRIVFTTLVLAGALAASTAQASIIGDTIQLDWLYPSESSPPYATTGSVVMPATGSVTLTKDQLTVTVSDGFIDIANATHGWADGGFNGFRLFDPMANFMSFTLLSVTNPPPLAPLLSFTAHELLVNFTPTGEFNIASVTGLQYKFAFASQPAPVPEPGSLALLVIGFAGLGLARGRLRASRAS